MTFSNFDVFLAAGSNAIGKGPIAIVFAEDDTELTSTVDHYLWLGFKKVIAIGEDLDGLSNHASGALIRVQHTLPLSGDMSGLLNKIFPLVPNQWVYYCYNAEYLYYPFCEHRSIAELVAFSMEERRDSILSYVVDLYAPNLDEVPSGVRRNGSCLDRSGYYALARTDKWNNSIERQMDFFGGLRWRFEEHVPAKKRRIDRIALFRVTQGLQIQPDHTFNQAEYNTYACPWHHSITASICSFRTAKALKRNPGSTFDIETFYWHNSTTFQWSSQQLMDLGLMEPGQWF
ncbi:MAG: hypothetical protein ACPG5U_00795 [Planktomarina sp.]